MKRMVLIGFLFLFTQPKLFAQYEKDVQSIDSIIEALYAVISGDQGVRRDWDRMRNLFIPEAKLMPTGVNPQGKGGYRVLSIEDYITQIGPNLEQGGFHETEIGRTTERFRNVAHVFSSYESRRTLEGEVFTRGINSIQLFWDENRWWVVSVYWASENANHPIPEKYLDSGN